MRPEYRGLGLLLLGALAVACGDTVYRATAVPPDDIDHWAAVVLASDGTIRGASGLTPREAAAPLAVPELEDDDSIVAFGFAADSLSLFDLDDPSIPELPLRPSSDCEPDLGPPDWVQAVQGPLHAVPRMTSGWVAGACRPIAPPDAAGPLAICGNEFCGQSWSQLGCRLELDLESCPFRDLPKRLQLQLRPDGACTDRSTGCTPHAPLAPALTAIECQLFEERCVMEVFETPSSEIDYVRLADPPTSAPSISWSRGREELTAGLIRGLVTSDDAIYVSVTQELTDWIRSPPRDPRLIGIDRRTLDILVDRVMPRGFRPLVATPQGDGLIALRYEGGTFHIGRYTFEGDEVASSTLTFTLPDGHAPVGVEAVYDPIHDRLIIGVSAETDPRTEVYWVVQSLDPDRLELNAECVFARWRVQSFAPSASRLFVSDQYVSAARWLDLGTCEHGLAGDIRSGSSAAGPIMVVDADETLLLGISGGDASDAVHVFQDATERGAFAFYEGLGFVTAFERSALINPRELWSTVALAPSMETEDVHARLGRIDVANRRFLPTAIALGDGPAPDLAIDVDGNVWTILPWTGQVARVRAP